MNKTNLEIFKMSKAQMNNVNGGRMIKCNVLDIDSGYSVEVELESGTNVDNAVAALNDAYGDWLFITY